MWVAIGTALAVPFYRRASAIGSTYSFTNIPSLYRLGQAVYARSTCRKVAHVFPEFLNGRRTRPAARAVDAHLWPPRHQGCTCVVVHFSFLLQVARTYLAHQVQGCVSVSGYSTMFPHSNPSKLNKTVGRAPSVFLTFDLRGTTDIIWHNTCGIALNQSWSVWVNSLESVSDPSSTTLLKRHRSEG